MTENNLVTMIKYEGKDSINPAEQITLCKEHYNKIVVNKNGYQIIKSNSSIPNIWCESCNPVN
jgi:hypothetical protein